MHGIFCTEITRIFTSTFLFSLSLSPLLLRNPISLLQSLLFLSPLHLAPFLIPLHGSFPTSTLKTNYAMIIMRVQRFCCIYMCEFCICCSAWSYIHKCTWCTCVCTCIIIYTFSQFKVQIVWTMHVIILCTVVSVVTSTWITMYHCARTLLVVNSLTTHFSWDFINVVSWSQYVGFMLLWQ